MDNAVETQIAEAEERLRQAMLGSDVAALDELLGPELVFTNHLGQVLGKADDLDAHRSGIVKIDELELSDQRVIGQGNVAVVSVQVRLSGSYAGARAEGLFRFTRVWAQGTDGAWRVIAGHSTIIAA